MDKNIQALLAIKEITMLTDLIVKIESKQVEYLKENHDEEIKYFKESIINIVNCL